ncbi:hypothetical protein CA13_40200 [Planctomycetes bacterium CA13]|uniref:Rhodanese domain-containing protein n=1 Tax=Novipirellula herctigrandis TaxID=2527986 RepID=A0A5C5Z662_9BACT|nr:hypothetical protein CA13_40200 [Planctomycetes bacterium CA13]
MAKCDLSIELEKEPEFLHDGGATIRGTLHVHVDKGVSCSGLVVESVWRTHGQGNVAKGTAESKTLFKGEWTEGQSESYPFELSIAEWPPSYHGRYLNIDHYIDARAKIPWSFDPKASVPFLMRPTCNREQAIASTKVPTKQLARWAIGLFVVIWSVSFFGGFAVAGKSIVPFVLLTLVMLVAGGFYLFRVFLPRYLLGEVVCDFATASVAPGQQAQGELVVRPRRNVSINSISMTFSAREECVSGSGSNRKTHKHLFYEQKEQLEGPTTLNANKEHRFDLSVSLPSDAPYSIDLTDNKLIWSTDLRIDIPRWPDWHKAIPLEVLPSGKAGQVQGKPLPEIMAGAAPGGRGPERAMPSDSITFDETAGHLWAVRDDPSQREMLVDAVTGLTFQISARVERRLLYAGSDDPHVFDGGYAVWANAEDPPLPLVLYVPHHLADEFEQIGRELWHGQGKILGWDDRHERLQIRVDAL